MFIYVGQVTLHLTSEIFCAGNAELELTVYNSVVLFTLRQVTFVCQSARFRYLSIDHALRHGTNRGLYTKIRADYHREAVKRPEPATLNENLAIG